MNGRWRRLIALLPVLFVLACRVVDVTPTLPPATPTPAPPVASATQITAVAPSATIPVAETAIAETAVSATAVSPAPEPAPPPGTPTPLFGSLTIDQQNHVADGGLWGVTELSPVGQTFVPTADSLQTVTLWVATGGVTPVTLQVVVYAGGLDGRILGRSQPVDIPLDFAAAVHFWFATAVALQPGQLHTLEIARVGDRGNGAVGWVQHGGWNDPYPQGEAIVQGQPLPSADLWFSVGLQD